MTERHLYLIDASGFIFRAYHALPPLTRKTDNAPIGAVHGFCSMLLKQLRSAWKTGVPSHIGIVFDHSGKSFRHQIYPEYKANRPPTPEELTCQFPLIRDAVKAFGLKGIEAAGFEADDLIATYSRDGVAAGFTVTILSSDKDLMQLVDDKTTMHDPMKDRDIGIAEVIAKFGVPPEKVIDVQALAGDSVDNVPGVPGIGIKTAAALIQSFGSLDELLDRAGEISQPKRRENLLSFADQARLCRELVTLHTDTPRPQPLDDLIIRPLPLDECLNFMEAMTFRSLKRTATDLAAEIGIAHTPAKTSIAAPTIDAETPAIAVAAAAKSALTPKIDLDRYTIITDTKTLNQWLARAQELGQLAIDTETTSLDPMQAELVGIALALTPGEAAYIPLAHKAERALFEVLDDPADKHNEDNFPIDKALALLKPILCDSGILKIGQNLKYDMLVLGHYGLTVTPFDDTMLLSYCLEGGSTGAGSIAGHGMDALAQRWLDHRPISYKDVVKSGRQALRFDEVSIVAAARYSSEDADITLRLHRMLKPCLVESRLTRVYETLERPLVPILVAMQQAGIVVDRHVLATLSKRFTAEMAVVEEEVFRLADERFNIASPKQLGVILFEKFNITPGRGGKTPSGAWATGSDILEKIAADGYDIAGKVLEWRQWTKLKNTYTDALPTYINPSTGRIHTSYASASTTTGRLSSSEPNLQNIPIRSEAGREIRSAFIAAPGHKLISADYSQIELRVLAHIAEIDALRAAFKADADIHARTASEVFNIPQEGLDPMLRRRAKAINFGIIYGMSAFGLANHLRIAQSEAKQLIETYFDRFPGIRAYIDDTKESCRRLGYVETLFGRRCHYPEIKSSRPHQRAFMERAAINAPIQGTAADLIRRAMIRLPKVLAEAGLKSRLLLQVHDELILEAPDQEVDETIDITRSVMIGASLPAYNFSVPLKVEIIAADNWQDAH